MPKIIHPDNQIFCDDPKLKPIVQKLADKLYDSGSHSSDLGLFQGLMDTRNEQEINREELYRIIDIAIGMYRFSIDKLLNGRDIKIGREMLLHMALSKLDFPIASH